MPQPAHIPTDENRKTVRMLASVGVRHVDIAVKLGISEDTLTRHYRKELDDGRIDANAIISKTLFEQARAGNITAIIFWLKTRAGWREVNHLEIETSAKKPEDALSDEEMAAAIDHLKMIARKSAEAKA